MIDRKTAIGGHGPGAMPISARRFETEQPHLEFV
jgi:hypothetical protein